VVRRNDRRARGFDEQDVQDEIRDEIGRRKRNELISRILYLNSKKLLIWPDWLLPSR
jgi:hypothetical protein